MGFFLPNNKKIKGVFIQNAPNTYVDANLIPEDMQKGMKGWSKGKLVVGTGTAFEFAIYGKQQVDLIYDEEGNDKYGFIIEGGDKSNIIFLSSTSDGDSIQQDKFMFSGLKENKAFKIGTNATTKGDVIVFFSKGFMFVYFSNTPNLNTQITYFAGKDNKI